MAACLAAVEILQQSDHAVRQLWENSRFFQAALRAVGFDLGRTQTPITPLMVGEVQRAKTCSAALCTAGIFAPAVAFPTVPRGTARLRLRLSATHTREDLALAVQTLTRVGQACQVMA